MAHVRNTIEVDAPLEEVWRIGADPELIPAWNTTVTAVKDATGPLDQAGSRYTTVSKIAGRPIEVTWTVDRVEPFRSAEVSGTTPLGGHARQQVLFEPTAQGTRVTLDLDYELAPGLLAQIIDKVFAERAIERDVRHSGENLKALVEERVRSATTA